MKNGNMPIDPIYDMNEGYDSVGLTKREHFASQVLVSLAQLNQMQPQKMKASEIASYAVTYADELLKALEDEK